jgi:hypothetical protein
MTPDPEGMPTVEPPEPHRPYPPEPEAARQPP